MCVDMMTKNFVPKNRSDYLRSVEIAATALWFVSIFTGSVPPSAYTTFEVENIAIDAGWGIEPPAVGIRNDFVFKIVELGEREGTYERISSAFKNLDAIAMYGDTTKKIEMNSDPRQGYYFSPVIPTRTGTIVIDLKGEINGVDVDVHIPIEDVESTAILDFPSAAKQSSDSDVAALKNAISSLQKQILSVKSGYDAELSDDSISYDFAVFGMSLGAAGVTLAILSMTRKKGERSIG